MNSRMFEIHFSYSSFWNKSAGGLTGCGEISSQEQFPMGKKFARYEKNSVERYLLVLYVIDEAPEPNGQLLDVA